MNENLSQMVKEAPTQEENISFDPTESSETQERTSEDQNTIEIISLSDWFDNNVDHFPNIRKPTVSINGVDPDEQLIVTVSVPGSDNKRKLIVFDNAHETPVLNLRAMDMQVYNNGFRIIYDYGNGIFIKSYGIRTGLISVFCNDIDDILIPYVIVRSRKNTEEIQVPENIFTNREKLQEPVDMEALQLRYKQSSKAEDLQTNMDAIKWLVEKQGSIYDINHHLQIDNVIIDMLA